MSLEEVVQRSKLARRKTGPKGDKPNLGFGRHNSRLKALDAELGTRPD